MLEAAFWGLVQGLTEFLPISSSGHLVLVPAALDIEAPDLATTAVLHLGTLIAVLAYYRADVMRVLRFRTSADGRKILWLVALGSVPAAVAGLLAESRLEELFDDPVRVGWALLITGAMLWLSSRFRPGERTVTGGRARDAVAVGVAQASALVPGISRSGVTITAGLGMGLTAAEAARYSFLLSIPAIAGGGLLKAIDLADQGGLTAGVFVGAAVAAVSGYVAIAFLLRLLTKVGLAPFSGYCLVAGLAAVLFL